MALVLAFLSGRRQLRVESDIPYTRISDYELDKNEMKAADRLRKRVSDPQIWLVHVTLGYLHRFGGHDL